MTGPNPADWSDADLGVIVGLALFAALMIAAGAIRSARRPARR